MPMLDASWSPQIRKIGELERPDHWWLQPEHNCYFFGEYTSGAGYAHSSTNQIILNLKKKPSTRGTPQWPHKIRAMKMLAAAVRGALTPAALGNVTIIPIPPSKDKTHPEHDARMAVIAKTVVADARELIEQIASRDALHECDQRPRPDDLYGELRLNENLCVPALRDIVLLDDVITTGCSFVACHRLVNERFPGVPISGIFAARRALDRTNPFADLGV